MDEKNIVPTADLVQKRARDEKHDLALDRYFQGRLSTMRPLLPPQVPVEVPEDKEEIVEGLRRARQAILREPEGEPEEYSRVARNRLEKALELLLDQSMAEALEPQDPEVLWHEARRMVGILQRLEPVYSELPNLETGIERVASQLQRLEGNEDNEMLLGNLAEYSEELFDLIGKLTLALEQIPYPFEHAEGSVSCAQFVGASLPERGDVLSIARVASQTYSEVHQLYSRVMGGLAFIAEQSEAAVGLEPLPHPVGRNELE